MSAHGDTHCKQMAKDLEASIDEKEEGGFEQFVRFILWSVAMVLFGALLVFGLNHMEQIGRDAQAKHATK